MSQVLERIRVLETGLDASTRGLDTMGAKCTKWRLHALALERDITELTAALQAVTLDRDTLYAARNEQRTSAPQHQSVAPCARLRGTPVLDSPDSSGSEAPYASNITVRVESRNARGGGAGPQRVFPLPAQQVRIVTEPRSVNPTPVNESAPILYYGPDIKCTHRRPERTGVSECTGPTRVHHFSGKGSNGSEKQYRFTNCPVRIAE